MLPLISMLPALTRRKHCTSALRSTITCRALRRPGSFPTKLIVADSAMQIAAQFAFDQGGLAGHTGTAEITFAEKMNIAASANAFG